MTAKTAAEKMAEKAERMRAKVAATNAPATDQEAPAQPLPAAMKIHDKPVRSTVDLPPLRHNALKQWCGQAAHDIGVSRVTTQDVLRVMVTRLLTDATFARQIEDELRKEFARKRR
jgi:hypothetical protein